MGFLKRTFWGLAFLAMPLGMGQASAAPLFPDVPDNHWGKDAVAALAAKGLVEGYPDGTFKGDRAASRWETAMVVARLLAKMEQAHATFATKAEVDEIRKLAAALREELDAMGVRVSNLEESVDRLDQRVTELERISFYGSVETRVNFHSFRNKGNTLSDPTDALLNFNDLVGTAAGAGSTLPNGPAAGNRFDPFAFGAFPALNLDKGSPLINGTGFTSLAILGLNIRVSDDIDARAEFSAFASQGNSLVDLYYGVSAPYLSNAFTAMSTVTGGAGVQPTNHRPFTRMNLDHFWVHHKPTNMRLRVGSIRDLKFDEMIYARQFNPSAVAPQLLDSYGFQLTGQNDVGPGQNLSWEVLGTLLPDRNGGVGGNGYHNQAYGGNLAYNFAKDKGQVKVNFLRAQNESSGGAALQAGLISAVNNNATPWVNPNGFFQGQLNQLGAQTGLGTVSDKTPIPVPAALNDGITGIPGTPNFGNIGPQAQTSYGISGRYQWADNDFQPYLEAKWGHSDYRSNRNSSYSVDGDAFRIGAGAVFFDEKLQADVEYLSVDSTYDPFILQIPRLGGVLFNGFRFGENFFNQRGDLYNLHNTAALPHNREGFRAKLKWEFAEEGAIGVRVGFLDQKDPSLQDVRFSAGAAGGGAPNTPVLGFSPGFTEPVFGGFSPFTFAASGGNGFAVPLEAPTGSMDTIAVDGRYRWILSSGGDEDYWERGLTLTGGFNTTKYQRNSNLRALLPNANGIAGENVNKVDLSYDSWTIGVDYDLTKDFTLNLSYSEFGINGHYDPYGIYSAFAVANNTTNFDNFNLKQTQPRLGFEYRISDSIQWDAESIFISTSDRVSSAVFSTPVTPGFNNVFTPQRSVHPFGNEGIMINTRVKYTF